MYSHIVLITSKKSMAYAITEEAEIFEGFNVSQISLDYSCNQ